MEKYIERNKLNFIATALNNAIETYVRIINGDISATMELKNAVQNSIRELCTAILKEVGQD